MIDQGTLSTVIGGILGFVGALLSEWLSRRQSTGQEGVVVDGAATERRIERRKLPALYEATDALRASVRPVLTYMFFGAFVGFKLALLVGAVVGHPDVAERIAPLVWNEAADTLLAAVVGFWFGQRALKPRQ